MPQLQMWSAVFKVNEKSYILSVKPILIFQEFSALVKQNSTIHFLKTCLNIVTQYWRDQHVSHFQSKVSK